MLKDNKTHYKHGKDGILSRKSEITEEQVRDILVSTLHSTEELAVVLIMELLNGEHSLDKLRHEVLNEASRKQGRLVL